MKQMTPQDLGQYIEHIDEICSDETSGDEFLCALLTICWPHKVAQDS